MKLGINSDVCLGCGLCNEICPEVFGIKDEIAKVLRNPVTQEEEQIALEARALCPVVAITTIC